MRRRRAYLVGVGVLTVVVTVAVLLATVGVLVLHRWNDQADNLAKQLEKAGYTSVRVEPDVVTTYQYIHQGKNRAKKRTKTKVVDHYDVTAQAGSCQVEIRQNRSSTDYTVEKVNDTTVDPDRTRNMTASALTAYVRQTHNTTC